LEAPGIEPASPTPQAKVNTPVTATTENPLAQSLAREIEKCPELARLIEAWPSLPEALKTGILAMIEAAKPEIVNRLDSSVE
jgi:hypothetical protein